MTDADGDGDGETVVEGPHDDRWFRSRRVLWLLAAAVALPFLLGTIGATSEPWLPSSDNALIELRTLAVPGDFPGTGMYSRYGFHHPGPAEFVALALPLRLLGPDGLTIGVALLNAAAAIAVVLVLWRRGGLALAGLGAAMVLVLERSLGTFVLLDTWNPWIGVFPFVLALVLAWSVLCEDWWALPWLVAAGSFAMQAHAGYLGPTGAAVGLALGWTAYALVRRRVRARVLIAALGIGVVMWLPPIIDQVAGTGNLTAIADAMWSPKEPSAGLNAGAGIVARELGLSMPWITGDEQGENIAVVPAPLWHLGPAVVAFVVAMLLAWRARAADALRLQAVVAATAVSGWVVVAGIQGPLAGYLFRWEWVIAAFLWLSVVWSSWSWARVTVAARSSALLTATGRAGTGLAVLAWAGLAALTVATTWSFVAQPHAADVPGHAAAALADGIDDALRGRGVVLIEGEGDPINAVVFALLAEMRRRGHDVVLPPAFGFYTGPAAVATSAPDDVLTVAVNDKIGPHLARGETAIASYDALTSAERRELTQLAARSGARPSSPPILYLLDDVDRARAHELQQRDVRWKVFLGPAPPPTRTQPAGR